jgi:hypothetical protein
MPCRASSTCSGFVAEAAPRGARTYTERMGVPTSALLAPAPAAATDPMGHTTATTSRTSAIGPSVRGIEAPSIGTHPARAKFLDADYVCRAAL